MVDSPGTTKPLAVIIIGADALLAARPASPIQLWHACLAVGYDLAVPATWGDELVAAEALRALSSHPQPVAVMCSCPLVARTVARMHDEVAPHLISLVAPPVATARYLRRVHGGRRVHITYVGVCPSAADSAIDAWITPNELIERFAAAAIVLAEQPELFDSVIPPDRRRYLSQPGGLPTSERAATMARPRVVHEIDDDDVLTVLQRHLADPARALFDLGPRVGCACSGAAAGVPPRDARATVTVLEPPRSARPVMADPAGLGLTRRLPVQTWMGDAAIAGGQQPTARPAQAFPPPRPTAVPTHTTRSPMSWNLRDRAMPQPPATDRSATGAESASPPTAGRGATALAHHPGALRGTAAQPIAPARQPAAGAEASPPAPRGRYWFVARPASGAGRAAPEARMSEAAMRAAEDEALAAEKQMLEAEQRALAAEGDILWAEEQMLVAEQRAFTSEGETLTAEEQMLAVEEEALVAQTRVGSAAARRGPLDAPAVGSIPAITLPAPPHGAGRGAGRAMLDWMVAAPASMRGRLPDVGALRVRMASVRRFLHRPGDAVVVTSALLLLLVAMVYAAAVGRPESAPMPAESAPANASEEAGKGEVDPRSAGRRAAPAEARDGARSPAAVGGRGAGRERAASDRGVPVAPPTSDPARRTSPAVARAETSLAPGRGSAPARDSAIADSLARAAAAARNAELGAMRAELLQTRARLDSIARVTAPPVVRPPPAVPPPPGAR